jgi:hypothetical protein
MKCYDGVLSTDKAKYGIMSLDLNKQTYCRNEAIFAVESNKKKVDCSKFMTKDNISD